MLFKILLAVYILFSAITTNGQTVKSNNPDTLQAKDTSGKKFLIRSETNKDIDIPEPPGPADDISEPYFGKNLLGFQKFIDSVLNANIPQENKAPKGVYTVKVQFMVKEDGSISDIKAITKHGYGMEEETIRAIGLTRKWNPAIQNDKPIKRLKIQSVTFLVE